MAFIGLVGANASVGAVANVGGSPWVAVVAVPTFIKRIDSFTQQETHKVERETAIGGLATVGIGGGLGGGHGVWRGIGFVWRDLPKPDQIFES